MASLSIDVTRPWDRWVLWKTGQWKENWTSLLITATRNFQGQDATCVSWTPVAQYVSNKSSSKLQLVLCCTAATPWPIYRYNAKQTGLSHIAPFLHQVCIILVSEEREGGEEKTTTTVWVISTKKTQQWLKKGMAYHVKHKGRQREDINTKRFFRKATTQSRPATAPSGDALHWPVRQGHQTNMAIHCTP